MGNSRLKHRFVVQGDSMLPLLKDGDEVRIRPCKRFCVGDIVVAEHPFQKDMLLIKKITAIKPKGFILEGVNPQESTDSRTLGVFPKKAIVGKAAHL